MAKNRGGTESLKRKIDMLRRIKTEAPNKIGRMSVKHFKDNFTLQGFVDDGVNIWKKRKRIKHMRKQT